LMSSRVPKSRKPSEQLRRRNAPESWTVLPREGCKLPVPKWTGTGKAPGLWARLWRLPVAAYWHEQQIEPSVVGRYVTLSISKPESPAVSKLETELGLTPASLQRLRLVVEVPESKATPIVDPYRHLRVAE
jgi:hypothetical protein